MVPPDTGIGWIRRIIIKETETQREKAVGLLACCCLSSWYVWK